MAISKTKGLIDLADAKRYMSIGTSDTDDDRLIDALISQASVMIQKEVGCDIIQTTYTGEMQSGDGEYFLYLTNWPIVQINRVAIGRDTAFTATYSGSASHATIQVTTSSIVLRTTVSGVLTTSTFTFSSYATITLITDAIDAISGWSTTTTSGWASFPSADLIRMPAKSANDNSIDLEVPDESETVDYEIYDNDGKLYNPHTWYTGHNNIYIDYVAGYLIYEIPEPIQSACMSLVKSLFDLSQRDLNLKSERMGDYQYQMADKAGDTFLSSGGVIANNLGYYKRIFIP